MLRSCKAGYRECIIVLHFFPILCYFAHCITILRFHEFHRNPTEHRQRTPVKRKEAARIAFYKISDCFFQFSPTHLAAVSRKTIWHDHVACHFFCIAGFQHISRKTVSGCDQHIRPIDATQSVCHNRICRIAPIAMKAVGIRLF